MRPNSKLRLLIVFLINFLAISCQKMHDFTYSQYEVVQTQSKNRRVTIQHQRSILDYYQFPKAFEIHELLSISVERESQSFNMGNIDGQIDFLKDKMGQFLKLSQKTQLLVQNIKDIPKMRNDLNSAVKQQQFLALEEHEKELRAINDRIDDNALQLQKAVNQMMKKHENPLFKQASLNFQKRALQQKMKLYENLLSQARSSEEKNTKDQNDVRVTEYFESLNDIFEKQSGLIDTINTLLKSHNQLAILKARVTSYSSQIKAHDLTIAEKQQCHGQYRRIKQKQKHDKQVIHLIQTLKIKKEEFNEPNKYCQGVVTKLVQRVKKVMKGYDYVFSCAQGLDEARENRSKLKKQLDQAQRKLDQLQLTKGVEDFRRTFQHNREVVQTKIQDLKNIQLDQFNRDPVSMQSVIITSISRIRQIQRQISNLPSKTINNIAALQRQIRDKVQQIKELKAEYCKQNQKYVKNSKLIQDKLYKLQQQEEYNMWVRNFQLQKIQQLEAVKLSMAQIQIQLQDYMD